MSENKLNIIQDFGLKQDCYYDKNYRFVNSLNFLRRYRRDLIEASIIKESTGSYEKILDIGCGPAILYPEFLNKAKKYVVCDLVESNLDQIKKENPDNSNIEYLCSDLDLMDLDKESYDLIICSGAIEYTCDPHNNFAKLIEALKLNGLLICSFPNMFSPYRLWSKFIYHYIWLLKMKVSKKQYYYYNRYLFSESRLQRVIDRFNIRTVHVKYFGLQLLPQPIDRIMSNLDHTIMEYSNKIKLPLLHKLSSEFIVVVKK